MPLRLWHLASLDAPTVAIVWALAFAWVCRVRFPLWVAAVLASIVWATYVSDRLLDARRAIARKEENRLRERHFFHWRWRRVLAPAALAAALGAACLVFLEMPRASFVRGSIVAAAAVAYLSGVHFRSARRQQPSRPAMPYGTRRKSSRLFTKELAVGVLFAAGCALPAWNRSPSPAAGFLLAVGFFAALAWLNCVAIERWEDAARKGNGSGIARPACILGACAASAALASTAHSPRESALMFACAVAAFLLAALDRLRHRMTPLALRAAADLVLLTPLGLLWP